MEICILERSSCYGNDLKADVFRKFGTVREYEWVPKENLAETIGDAEVVLCNKSQMTEEVLAACKKLRYIGAMATGYNTIDVAACRKRGITVTNVPAYSTDAVAQLTFAFILQFATSLFTYVSSVQNGDWQRSPLFTYYPFPISEISGKTLGIFGMGTIGQKVASIGTAFGMKIIYHARTKKEVPYELVPLEELFARADYLSFHCPLNDSTRGIINAETLSLMKPTAFVINTARGGLAAEADLRAALDGGKIAGYAADVLSEEPQRADCPLIGAKNLFLTPHIAWAPRETRARLIGIAADNVAAYLAGNPQNVVS